MSEQIKPILSIITVVKDDLKGFSETLNSLTIQDFSNVEWVVIDSSRNNEVENSLLISDVIKDNSRYYWTEARGIYPAMNLGIEKSNGTWIWFLNAGDRIATNFDLRQLRKMLQESENFDAISFAVIHEISVGFPWSISIPRIVVSDNQKIIECNHQGFIARKLPLRNFGGFDESYRFAADSKLMDAFASKSRVLIVPVVLSKFAIGGASTLNYRKVLKEIRSHRRLNRNLADLVRDSRYQLQNLFRKCLIALFPRLSVRAKNFLVRNRKYS